MDFRAVERLQQAGNCETAARCWPMRRVAGAGRRLEAARPNLGRSGHPDWQGVENPGFAFGFQPPGKIEALMQT